MQFLRNVCRNAERTRGFFSLMCPTVSRRYQPNLFANVTKNMTTLSTSKRSTMTPALGPGESFEERNKRLKRPISPHLTVYKWRNNMILSMMHRFTGIALYGIPFGLAAVAIVLPESFPYYVGLLEEMDFKEFILTTLKFFIAFPFCYHFWNGIRHLICDAGFLWSMKQINISCYIVVFLAIVLAIHLTTLQH